MESSDRAYISPEIQKQAHRIVENSILHKGDVSSLPSAIGNIKSFLDALCPEIWDGYIQEALTQVDAGNWKNADNIARNKAVNRVIDSLNNQI